MSVGPVEMHWIPVGGASRVRERAHLKGWGAWNLEYTRDARVGAQNQKSSAAHSMSVGPAGTQQPMVAGAFGMRENHHLKGWGAGARDAQGGL